MLAGQRGTNTQEAGGRCLGTNDGLEPDWPEPFGGRRLSAFGVQGGHPACGRQSCEWSITVSARNESEQIEPCLASIAAACSGKDALVSILVNGTTDDTVERARAWARAHGLNAVIYDIPYPDKSNAWNQFMYSLRPAARRYFFVDGHVTIAPDSLRLLSERLGENPHLNAVSGTPLGSRGSPAWREMLLSGGAICGCLHVLSDRLIRLMHDQPFLLPVGLYRGDGLLNSFSAHDGKALSNQWDSTRAIALPDAHFRPLPWRWERHEIARHLLRRVRQGRGRLENEAIKSVIFSRDYAALPPFASAMIIDWIKDDRSRLPRPERDPFAFAAWLRLRRDVFPPVGDLQAKAVFALEA